MEEKNGNFIDFDFLHTYCVGYDEESMPENAKLHENFKDYVVGAYDDIPKTPQWAANICGTPVEDITWYAKQMAKDHKVAILHNLTIGAMGGHIGKSGHACGMRCLDFGDIKELKETYGEELVSEIPILPLEELTQPGLLLKVKEAALSDSAREVPI